jgi:L-ectoine synthase
MIVINEKNKPAVKFTGGVSIRLSNKSDNMGFSVCKTLIPKGKPNRWHYTNHLESCYCILGRGELVNLDTGDKYIIEPGVMYSHDKHEPHTFEAFEDTVLISIFNPPLRGDETHDKNGIYN